jgi:hypothetical protein
MGRTTGQISSALRARRRPRAGAEARDPVTRALHHLGNNINSLALRLYVLQKSDLGGDANSHLNAAHRLTQQSIRVIEEIHAMLVDDGSPSRPPAGPRAAAPARRNRRK